jgi:hypothetical protein
MSNSSYDALWHDAMGELHEQLYVEGVGDDEELVEGPKGVSLKLFHELRSLINKIIFLC